MKKVLLFSVLVAVLGCSKHNPFDNENHNGNGVAAKNVSSATLDPVAGCDEQRVHRHGDIDYSGHYNNDGHGHHGLAADDPCGRADCDRVDSHEHDGNHYAGHNNSCCGNSGHHGRMH